MDIETYEDAVNIKLKIDSCKERIKQLENARKFPDVIFTNAFADDLLKEESKIILPLKYKIYDKYDDAFQLFLDSVLSIEDETLHDLEIKFEEL